MVKSSSAKMRPLRDRRLRTDPYLSEIIDPHAITDSGLICDGEVPWNRDPNSRMDTDLATDPRAEQSK